MRLPRLLTGLAAGALLTATARPADEAGPAVGPPSVRSSPGVLLPAAGNARRSPVVTAVERVRPAVVNIQSERHVAGHDTFGTGATTGRVNGMGTGIIIDQRGYIVTNQHVVDDVQVLRVVMFDGSTLPARVVGRDAEQDLALLKVDSPRPLAVIPFGTANDLMVGETVLAIGNAFGYTHTVSAGVVSAINRDVSLNKEITYRSLIQTDASINPGNSGGPLVNVNGELVGVNVAIRAGAQGIGFAITVDNMMRTAADMLARRRGNVWYGLTLRDQVETPNGTPVRVLAVDKVAPNSPAAQAGFHDGDVISRAGDMAVTSRLDLERALIDKPAGEQLAVSVRRSGAEQALTLATRGSETQLVSTGDTVWRKLGVKIAPVGVEQVVRVNPQLDGGLLIVDLANEGIAGQAGLRRGDILVGLHLWKTVSVENVVFVLTHPELTTFTPVKYYVIRAGQLIKGNLPQFE